MVVTEQNQMLVPFWSQQQGLAASGPLAACQLEHVTWRNRPRRSAVRVSCHRHAVFHMVSFCGGHGTYMLDNKTCEVDGRVLILTNPDQPHSFASYVGDRHDYNEITFTAPYHDWSALLADFFEYNAAVPSVIPLSADMHTDFEDTIRQMVRILAHHHPQGRQCCGGCLYQELFWLYRLLLDREARDTVTDEWDDLRAWIERHAEESWGLEELAAIMHCSSKHVSRQFARRFGEPPLRYKKQVLLQRAQVLLRTSNLSLQDISEMLGIEDAHYFNRLFRRHFGIAPGRYRQQQRRGDV